MADNRNLESSNMINFETKFTKKSRFLKYSLIAVLFSLSVLSSSSFAAIHYVRSGAGGTGSGKDWTNAYTKLPATLVRGDTYYVADGNYSSYNFDDGLSGTTYITVKKATAADHGTDTGWDNSYGDGTAHFGPLTFTAGYVVFDGQKGTGKSSDYGFKVAYSGTANGIVLVRLKQYVSHVKIHHTEMQHAGAYGDNWHDIIHVKEGGNSHLHISHSYLHDVGRMVFWIGDLSDSIFENLYIARNDSTSAEHAEGLGAKGCDRIIFRNSVWEDIEGTGIMVLGWCEDWEIYGNTFFHTPGFSGAIGNGTIATWQEIYNKNVKVHNNTFVGIKGTIAGLNFPGTSSTGNEAYNNLWHGCQRVGTAGFTHDYNYFSDNVWATSEPNGQYASGSPFVDVSRYDFRLQEATKAGKTLADMYGTDMTGNTRGGDGVWDRGAMEFGSTSITRPEPPQNLHVDQ